MWIHGDLHAENFGTYMDATGRLIFNVNDFDEAYVGPFTWDLKRFAASVALIGYAKALSDEQITELVRTYAAAYRERIHALATGAKSDEVPPFTLDTAQGPLLDALRDARSLTRFGLLDSMTEIRDFERRFAPGGGSIELDAATRYKVLAAFDGYLETLPESSPDPPGLVPGQGRRGPPRHRHRLGRACPRTTSCWRAHSDALENDVVIYMKQAQTPAVSRHITDPAVRDYFQHEGHRTVISQRALQAHADPWLGWTELDGAGQLVAEVSPYAVDLDWSRHRRPGGDRGGRRRPGPGHGHDARGGGRRERPLLVPFSTERAIDAAIAADEDGFARAAGGLRARVRRTGACRPPDLRGPVPQRPDPGSVDRWPPGSLTGTLLGIPYRSTWHTLHAMDISGTQLRAVRAALFTALVVTLSAASHVLLSRVPLPLPPWPRSPPPSSSSPTRWRAASAASGGSPALLVPLELAADTRLHHRPARLLRPGGRPGRRPAALGRPRRAVRRRQRRRAAGRG